MGNLVKHVEWLLTNRGDELKQFLDKNRLNLSPEHVLETMQSADPSTNKLATQWLFERFLTKGYRWEDIQAGSSSKVSETLTGFGQHRDKLRGNSRNLDNYKRLAQVFAAVEPYLEETQAKLISAKMVKKQAKEVALAESLIIWRSEDLIVSVPQTKRAAQWWGKRTQWCTAARENNYFDGYNNTAPLVIFTFPKGLMVSAKNKNDDDDHDYDYDYYSDNSWPDWDELKDFKQNKGANRLQLWIGDDGDIQLMDEQDNQLNGGFIAANWEKLSSIFEWIFVKTSQLDDKHSLETIVDDLSIGDIVKQMTDRQISNIFQSNPQIAAYLNNKSKQIISDQMWLEHIDQVDAGLLPEHLWNSKTAELFILKDSANIKLIPDRILTDKFCAKISANLDETGQQKFVVGLKKLKSDQKLSTQILKKFEFVRSVKAKMSSKTENKKHNKSGLNKARNLLNQQEQQWLDRLISKEIDFKWIPYEQRTPNLSKVCLQHCLATLNYIPESFKTQEICQLAIAQGAGYLYDVPKEYRTIELFEIILEKNNLALLDIPVDEFDQSKFERVIERLLACNLKKSVEKSGWENNSSILREIPDQLLKKYRINSLLVSQIIDFYPPDLVYINEQDLSKSELVRALIKYPAQIEGPIHLLDNNDLLKISKENRHAIEPIIEKIPDFLKNNQGEFDWKIEQFSDLCKILSNNNPNTITDEDEIVFNI